jgi:hypothetical protein
MLIALSKKPEFSLLFSSSTCTITDFGVHGFGRFILYSIIALVGVNVVLPSDQSIPPGISFPPEPIQT